MLQESSDTSSSPSQLGRSIAARSRPESRSSAPLATSLVVCGRTNGAGEKVEGRGTCSGRVGADLGMFRMDGDVRLSLRSFFEFLNMPRRERLFMRECRREGGAGDDEVLICGGEMLTVVIESATELRRSEFMKRDEGALATE